MSAAHFREHHAVVERERLRRAPELPVLASVCGVLDIAIAVLRARHPFLGGSTAVEDVLDPQPIMLAEIVRLHAVALRSAISRYRDGLASEGGCLDDENLDIF